jgi:hypothetical protein
MNRLLTESIIELLVSGLIRTSAPTKETNHILHLCRNTSATVQMRIVTNRKCLGRREFAESWATRFQMRTIQRIRLERVLPIHTNWRIQLSCALAFPSLFDMQGPEVGLFAVRFRSVLGLGPFGFS